MDERVFSEKRIERTADGSATIYLPLLDEHYHSVKGAYTESMHIFINCGLLHAAKDSVRMLEVGFGTGLNASLTAVHCEGKTVDYFTLERYPLSFDEVENAGYRESLSPGEWEAMEAVHRVDWEKKEHINDHFSINKLECDLTDGNYPLPEHIDVVYFDAFAPEKQPEMWSDDVFRRIFKAMNSGSILTTYCAKGEIRRRLQATGFAVERLAGPPGGKREILRAVKP